MRKLILLFALLLLESSHVIADIPTRRHLSQCTYLMDKIYCYGGGNITSYPSDVIYLPVHNNETIDVNELQSLWKSITPIPNYGSEGRVRAQVFASKDRTKMYIQGGSASHAEIQNPFIVFDASNETWSTLKDYNKDDLERPIFDGTVVYSPYLDKYVFYGGYMLSPKTETHTLNGIDFATDNGFLYIGFNNITVFDIEQKKWTIVNSVKNQDISPIEFRSEAVARNDSALYLGGGGAYRCNVTDRPYLTFDHIRLLSFTSYLWQHEKCTGDIPPIKDYFTLTLSPDNETILLYGGITVGVADMEYNCYLLDISTKIWRLCSDHNSNTVYENRYGHSAVLVGSRLFILFGIDEDGIYRSDMIILDISDKNNISVIRHYAYKNDISMSTAPPDDTSDPEVIDDADDSSRLGPGVIIGIICLFAVILCILFLIHQKKKPESIYNFPEGWDDDIQEQGSIYRDDISSPNNGPIADTAVSPVTAEVISAMKREQYEILKPENIHAMKPEQSNTVKPEQSITMKPEQSNTIKPEQIKEP